MRLGNDGDPLNCANPIDPEVLADYWIAALASADEEAVEVHLLECGGIEQLRLSDVPVNPAAGNILYQESITFAKAAPTHKMIARLVAVDEGGDEHLLGEYTFDHKRSLPGPGAW